MKLRPGAHLPGGPLHNWQLGVVFFPFLLPLLPLFMVYSASKLPPLQIGSWIITGLIFMFIGVLLVISIAGLIRSFPVWALPALGTVLFFFSAFLQLIVQTAVFFSVMVPLYGGWPELLEEKIWTTLLVQLVYFVLMAAMVAGLLRLFPGFYKQVRLEWTLLSFLLYGIAILPVLGNDEFHGVERYEIASLLILAVGATLYVNAPARWQRVLALVIPAILSPVIMSLGLYQTFPAQAWADPANASFRIWEALQPVLYLCPLPILLLLAALAPRLTWLGGSAPTASP